MTRVRHDGGVSGVSNQPTTSSGSGIWTLKDAEKYSRSSSWPTYVPPSLIDPQFDLTTLLIHADGTNGANNSVFLDSSTSFIPFSNTYSYYFNPSSQAYLTMNGNGFAFGTGNFTFECWVYPTAALGTQYIFDARTAGIWAVGWGLSGTSGQFGWFNGTSTLFNITTIPINTWTHIAIVRSSTGTNGLTLYINGVSTATATDAANYTGSSGTSYLGYNQAALGASYFFPGYISNLRIVSGTAVYNSNFTPPTTPLTAISGTTLLTCQSSTIRDNSASALTITNNLSAVLTTAGNNLITTNGTATQGTFSPFSQTGWSNYYNGTTDYIQATVTAPGTGDFTIEGWVNATYFAGTTSQVSPNIFSIVASGSSTGFQVAYASNGFDVRNNSAVIISTVGASYAVIGTWVHVALVRSSGVITLYLNGTSAGTTSTAYTFSDTQFNSGNTPIGQYFYGYVSNIRYTTRALYTSNFTPSTTALTAVANTVLLTAQSNRFVDNSASPLTISTTGTPSIRPFSPFPPSVPYTTANNGGAAYFNGTTDYITVPSSPAFDVSTSNNWTFETWVYPTANQSGMILMNYTSSSSPIYGLQFYMPGDGTYRFGTYNGSAAGLPQFYLATPAGSVTLNAWSHIALVRNGSATNNMILWLNGVAANTGTYTTWPAPGQTPTYIATTSYQGLSSYFPGYISNMRMIKGVSVYTSVFTPPTTPLTSNSSTVFLLNATNAGIFDQTSKNDLVTYGTAAISTTQSKFGGSSMYFDGTTPGYALINNPNYNGTFNTGNFTIEAWIYVTYPFGTTGQGRGVIVSNRSASTSSTDWSLQHYNGKLYFSHASTDPIVGSASLTTNTWIHVAVVKNGTALTSYINGIQDVSVTNSDNFSDNQPIGIGLQPYSNNYPFTGYIDDLRITKYARYTTNFTPYPLAFQNQ